MEKAKTGIPTTNVTKGSSATVIKKATAYIITIMAIATKGTGNETCAKGSEERCTPMDHTIKDNGKKMKSMEMVCSTVHLDK